MAKKVYSGLVTRLALGGLADQPLAVLGEGDDRGRGARAFGIFDDLGGRALHDGDARIGRAEVDADDFSHVFFLSWSGGFLAPKAPSGPSLESIGKTGKGRKSLPVQGGI